jgi:hypothetical protein
MYLFFNVDNYKFYNQDAQGIAEIVEQMVVKEKTKRISMT